MSVPIYVQFRNYGYLANYLTYLTSRLQGDKSTCVLYEDEFNHNI